jgi:hypothetical protein
VSFKFPKFARLLPTVAVVAACSDRHEPTTPGLDRRAASVRVATITLDGDDVPGGYVVRRRAAKPDSIPLDASGAATVSAFIGDTLSLTIAPPATTQYYASAGTFVVGGDTTIDVVLIPTSWTLRRGRYAGARRAIDIVKAFGSDADDTHFLNYFSPAKGTLLGWSEDNLPISVGYDTTGSTRRWTPADSAWFWSTLIDMNEALGRTMFVPVTTVGLTTPGAIGVRVDYSTPGTRQGSLGIDLDQCKPPVRVCSGGHGTIVLGYPVFFRPVFDEENFRVMQHEMMHALGFGHACYWPSVVMHTGVDCAPTVPKDVSVDDAAYVELVLRLVTILKAHPSAWNLDEASKGRS